MPTIWLPDYPPASPSSYDDEFDDAAVAAAWTQTLVTATENAAGLHLQGTHATAWGSVTKAIPAGDWQVYTKVGVYGSTASSWDGGGLLLQDNSTGSAYVLVYNDSGRSSNTIQYVVNSGETAAIVDRGNGIDIYLRFRKNGTTYDCDYSYDGVGWQRIYSGTLPFTPTKFGLLAARSASIAPTYAFFRCVEGTPGGVIDVLSGRRVDPNLWGIVPKPQVLLI